jgi:hypothetical protein
MQGIMGEREQLSIKLPAGVLAVHAVLVGRAYGTLTWQQ